MPVRRRAVVEVAFWAMRLDAQDVLIWVRVLIYHEGENFPNHLPLGLPAFEPGQKVEIDFGMDDI